MINKDQFLGVVDLIATWSKEPDTKTAAVIARGNDIVSMGWNSLPDGSLDKNSRSKKPWKYIWYEHAERNAIYAAARMGVSTEGCTMYMRWFPCSDCARAIIQSGIKTLVCEKPGISRGKVDDKYHFTEALEMLEEAEIELQYI